MVGSLVFSAWWLVPLMPQRAKQIKQNAHSNNGKSTKNGAAGRI
jgi:hypothetical protein